MIVVVMKTMIVVVVDYIHININDMKLINLLKEQKVNEGKLGDTWRKNNKKGFVLKVGNIELKSAGPSNSHDILVDRMPWGTFMMDYEAGGDDWWVKPTRGKDFWVDSIDDLVKKIKGDSRIKESINEASEIDYKELDSTKQKLVKLLEGFFDGKMQTIYDGIHGNIVEIKVGISGTRLTKGDLKELAAMNIRWIEYDNRMVSVGF